MSTATAIDDATKPQGGAPRGNVNAMRHGLRSGSDPPGCSYITRQASEFRQSLEAKVLAKTGEIDVYESSLIHTAVSWLKHGLKCRRWLRINFNDLSADQRVTYSREAPRAFESMTRCLKLLGLDVRPESDPWAALDLRPAITDATQPNSDDVDASPPADTCSVVSATDDTPDTPEAVTGEPRNDAGLAHVGDTS